LKYLEKLQLKFPKIQIFRSEFYDEKSKSIENTGAIKSNKIPIDLWLNAAANATDYFLLLEDDIWFTQKLNLKETTQVLKDRNVAILKLIWLNNPKLIHGKTTESIGNVKIFEPKLVTKNPILFRIIFQISRFNNRKLMKFLNLYSKEKALHYYSIYGVAGAIFEKKYFLSLWKGNKNVVNEHLQLKNAVKYWYRNPKLQFARTHKEFVATGFSSSATNKNFDTGSFDSFSFNKILNEAWYKDEFDVMCNFPEDLNVQTISEILSKENNPLAQVEDWQRWVYFFKKQFQDFGCKI
jgi:hypothetical protein